MVLSVFYIFGGFMVYKIEGVADLSVLPPMEEDIKAIIYHHAKILSEQYGDSLSDGGYVLYVTPDSDCNEILTYFDYRCNVLEYAERIGEVCIATYVTNNEHVVVIILSTASAPDEIAKELEN